MSLSIYLYDTEAIEVELLEIPIIENGSVRFIGVGEWNWRHPEGKIVAHKGIEDAPVVFNSRITANLYPMAKEAGLGDCLWDHYKMGITRPRDLVKHLEKGLQVLLEDPKRFKALNPENGWGTYETLVRFVTEYLKACVEYPYATISAS